MEFSEWLQANFSTQLAQTNAKIITLCWSIWRARNDLVWNNKRWTTMQIVAKAWEYLSQWKLAQNRFFGAPLQAPVTGDGVIVWAKPPQNAVKMNVDAAFFVNREAAGVGVVVRDWDGRMLGAKVRHIRETMEPSLVEAIAVKEALSWAKEWSNSTVIIESDCLVVVQLIRRNNPMRSRLGQVVLECRRLIRDLNNVKLFFVIRSANMSAHELARVAHMYPDRVFDWSYVPINVQKCILNELME